MATGRTYGGVSAEQRRADRRARLIDAALDLLAAAGLEAVTMTTVCARAQLTERYFYESFPNRAGLLAFIVEDAAATGIAAMRAALIAAPADRNARARAVVEALIDLVEADSRRARIMARSQDDDELKRWELAITRTLGEFIGEHADAFWERRDRGAAELRLAGLVAMSGIGEILVAWLAGDVEYTRADAVDRCVALFGAVERAFTDSPLDRSPEL